KNTFVDRIVDKSVENVENYSGFSEENTTYPEKTAKTVDKFGENVDNFVEKTVEKSEKKEFPIVDNMEKTNEEQADKSVEEDEKIYEEELTLHPEFDFTQGNDKTLEQAIKKLETEKPVQRF
ncbi:DNA mismatch repair endonuclease MutL, partial [Enterococcus faecium]